MTTLDVRGLKCPLPIVKAKKHLDTMTAGDEVEVLATDPGSVADFQGWARTNKKAELVAQRKQTDEAGREVFVHLLKKKG